jgi:L-lactate dehydrogenase complex protein LldG
MLPFVNVVFVNANYMVENITSACQIIGKVFQKGYCGFVTGPSRTADIERVLSLGVHGPNKLIIIAVENEGGAK